MNNPTPKQVLVTELAQVMTALGLKPFSQKRIEKMAIGVVRVNLGIYSRLLSEKQGAA